MNLFVPKTWNADERVNAGGTLTTNFSGGWQNRMKQDGSWEKINIDFTEDSTSFFLGGTPFGFHAPKKSGGEIRFDNSVNFDPHTNSVIEEPVIGKTKMFTGTYDVPGAITKDGILYKGAYSFGDILLQSHQQHVKQLVVFNEEPSGTGDVEIPFIQEVDAGTVASKTAKGMTFMKGKRSIYTKPAFAWDSNGKYFPLQVTSKKVGRVLTCKKIIPRSVLKAAVYPLYADTVDTFTSDTADSGILSYDATFATARAPGANLGLESVSNTRLYAVCWRSGDYFIYRSYLWWATGATIPSGNTISAASLAVDYPDTHAALSRTVYLVENRQASTTLATTDYPLIGASGVGTGTGQPFGSITRGVSDAGAVYTFTINSDGQAKIAKGSGNTFFAVSESDDWGNSAPGAEDTAGSSFQSANAAGTKPILSVTHASASRANRLSLLGIG